jgi:hypothetical protein
MPGESDRPLEGAQGVQENAAKAAISEVVQGFHKLFASSRFLSVPAAFRPRLVRGLGLRCVQGGRQGKVTEFLVESLKG